MGVLKCCMIVGGIFLILAGVGMIGFNFVGKSVIKTGLTQVLNEIGPETGKMRVAEGAALDVYLYNVTNVNGLIAGSDSMPKVQEVGPFRFLRYGQELNVQVDGATYTAKEVVYYQYVEDDSCKNGNCKKDLTDSLTVLDTTYHGLVSGMLHGTLGEAGAAALFGAMTSQTACGNAYPKAQLRHGASVTNAGTKVYFQGEYTDCETKLAMMTSASYLGAADAAAVKTALDAIALNVTRYYADTDGGFGTTCGKARVACFATMYKSQVDTSLVVTMDATLGADAATLGPLTTVMNGVAADVAAGGQSLIAAAKYYQIYGDGTTPGAMTVLQYTGKTMDVTTGTATLIGNFNIVTQTMLTATQPRYLPVFAILAGTPMPLNPLLANPCGAGFASACPTSDKDYHGLVQGSFAVGAHAFTNVYNKIMDTTKHETFLQAATYMMSPGTGFPIFTCNFDGANINAWTTAAQTDAATKCAGSADVAVCTAQTLLGGSYACAAGVNYWDAVDATAAGTKMALQEGIKQTFALGNLTKGSFNALHMYAVYGALFQVKATAAAGGAAGLAGFRTGMAGYEANGNGPFSFYDTAGGDKWSYKKAQALFAYYINTLVPQVIPKMQYFKQKVTAKQALLTGYVSLVGGLLKENDLVDIQQPAQNLFSYHTMPLVTTGIGLSGTPEKDSVTSLHKVKQMSGDGGWDMNTIIPSGVAPSTTDKCGDVLMTQLEAKYGTQKLTTSTKEHPDDAYEMVEVDGKTSIKGICKKTAASGWSSEWVKDELTWGSEKKVSGKTGGFASLVYHPDHKYETESVWNGAIGRPQTWTYAKDRVASTPTGLLPADRGLYELQRTTFIGATDLDSSTAGAGDKSCGSDGNQACPACMKDISAVSPSQAHIALSGPNFQDCSIATDGASFAEVTSTLGIVYTDASSKQKWTALVAPHLGARVGLDSNLGVYAKLTRGDLTAFSASMCSASTTKSCQSNETVTSAALCGMTTDDVWASPQEWPASLASCSAAVNPNQDIYVPIARIHVNAQMNEAQEILIFAGEVAGNLITSGLGQALMIAGIAVFLLGLVCCVCACRKKKDKVAV